MEASNMPKEIKLPKRNSLSIDERCRWRNPRTEERCPLKAEKKPNGTQTGYFQKHTGLSGITQSSLLSTHIPSGLRRSTR